MAATYVVGGTTSSQVDPDLGSGQSFRFPLYGSRAARVNYKDTSVIGKNKNANVMQQSMVVSAGDVDPLDSQVHVRFAVAPVLENPAHNYNEQPYYFVQLENVTRGTVLYGDFNSAGQAGVPWKTTTSIVTGNSTLWKDWSLVDVAPGPTALAIGDTVKLTVVASGCKLGGHFGRVYVDGLGPQVPGLMTWATGPQSVNAGGNVTYTIYYRNGATTSSVGTTIDFATPPQTTYVSTTGSSCSGVSASAAGTLTCALGTLAPGAAGSFTVTVATASTATGSIVNGNYAIGAVNASRLVGPRITTTVNAASTSYTDMSVEAVSVPASVNWGQSSISFTITVTNRGLSTSMGSSNAPTFTATFPSQLTNVSWSCTSSSGGSNPYCDAVKKTATASGTGNISIRPRTKYSSGTNGVATFTVTANVVAGSGGGTITIPASVSAAVGTADSNLANNATTITIPIGTPRTLTVSKAGSTSSGTVTSSTGGINCGATCSRSFADGTTVVLTATPNAGGATFSGWSGACAGSASTCTVTMNAAKSVTATFAAAPSAGAPAFIYAYRGDGQRASTSTAFGTSLQALVTDANGIPLSGRTVAFSVPSSGASATRSATSATTNSAGIATITATANATAGTYAVTASTSDGGSGTLSTTFNLTNIGPATSIAYVQGGNVTDPQRAVVSTGFTTSLMVLLTDAAGNPVPGATVSYAGPATGARATLSAASAVTNVDGQAFVTATANATAGSYTVNASTSGVASTVAFSLQNVSSAPAAIFVVSGTPQVTPVSTSGSPSPFGADLVVVVADAAGNAIPGVTVSFAKPSSGASCTLSSATATTDSLGQATVSATANTIAGQYLVTASVAGVAGTASFSLANDGGDTITADSGTPQAATVNAAFGSALRVLVVDSAGAPVSGAVVTFTVPGSGATATLSSATATTNASGLASVTATAGSVGGTYSVVATTPNAGTAADFTLTNDPFVCTADNQCPSNEHCSLNAGVCSPDKANGVAIPSDGLHDGTCTNANASAVCLSGTCNATTNTCGGVNGVACTQPNECVVNVCGTNGSCGEVNGVGPCAGNAAVCQSGICSANSSTCIAAGTCWDGTDCAATAYCTRATGTCTALSVCTSSQYEASATNGLVDRVCANLTTCTGSQYQSTAPTSTSDRVCTNLTTCTGSQYQSTAPTSTSDRVCTNLTTCTGSQYESTAPTSTSDRVCTNLTTCTGSQYQSTAPTSTSDRVCTNLTTCTGSQYQSTAPTSTSDRVCTNLTTCTGSQYESTAPTSTSDRVCTSVTTCTSSQYETAAPTATSDRVCTALTQCQVGEYEATPPTPVSDRVCAPLSACGAGYYEATPPTATTNRVCLPVTVCTATEYEALAPTASADRVCAPKKTAGQQLPTTGPNGGGCSSSVAVTVCYSGQCNAATNTCSEPNGTSCVGANECTANACGSNGLCGSTNGTTGCTSSTASTCQSGSCSPSGACVPSGGCWDDSDCNTATQFCKRDTFTCTAKAPNGVSIPAADGLHSGTCTTANATAVCVSALCNATTGTCGGAVGATCVAANGCAGNVCEGSTCGYANGSGPCVGAASSCQSGTCNPTASASVSACIPQGTGKCWVDGDCDTTTQFCERSTFTCTAKKQNGLGIPNDGLHTGTCNASNATATCVSGQCNATTNTCGGPVGETCTNANQCVVNVCGTNGKCGWADGYNGCTAGTATTCQSGACTGGVCTPAAGCYVDGDCPGNQHCNRNAFTCVADLANGVSIPNDGLHTGLCDATNAAAVCTSGQCNATTNTCAGPNTTTSCTLANECVTNVCGSNGKCGTTTGGSTPAGGCTSSTAATVCQSSTCSVNGANCIPATNGCYVDGDCAGTKHCNRNTLTCVDDKANGVSIPNDGLHDGTCTASNAAAVCTSGQCNAVSNTCAGPNVTTSCTAANECVANACGSNGKCGTTNGSGPCFGAASTCQSGVCNLSADASVSACVPQGTGKCWVDADCPTTDYCARSSFTCRPKESNGTPLPTDTLHDSCGAGEVNAACVSGRCNPTTNTCGGPNVTTSCTNPNQCIANVCGTNGKCGSTDGESGCTASTAAAVCQSATCSTNTGTCIAAGTCWADADCASNQHCNRNTGVCTADKANGVAIPSDGLHTGVCNASNAGATCESAACNTVANTCAGPNVTTSCVNANECITNACGTNGKCGLANGQAGCTSTNTGVCQSSTCSVDGDHCIPATNGCYVDRDCPTAKHCDRSTLTCADDKAAGVAIPNDGLHTGVCNDANATATCLSGKCNVVTNTCAEPNGNACTGANQCVVNVCGSNGKCGRADGEAGCTTEAPAVCQSNVCAPSGVCLPAGKCWVDSDCPATDYCARNVNTCRPKEASGTAIPNDGLHDGGCTEANAQATCASGKCNAETRTCGDVNASTCAQASQCSSNVCFSDGACGLPGSQRCTTDSACRSGLCAGGFCAVPDSEVRGSGGLSCAVATTNASSEDTSPGWLFGLALTLAVSRRRKGHHDTTSAQR